jgi:hypothetical protein
VGSAAASGPTRRYKVCSLHICHGLQQEQAGTCDNGALWLLDHPDHRPKLLITSRAESNRNGGYDTRFTNVGGYDTPSDVHVVS